jgi:hypothetical protein
MAIIKMQKVKAGKAYGLKAVLEYIQNPDKTNGGLLLSAKDCLLECAYKQMLLVKHDHLQDSGRQYVHIIQSFSINDKLTGEIAHEIGHKLLQSFDGFQGVVATHTDRKHIHNHMVLNSVNWKTGLKWQQSKKDLQELKDLSDRFCKEYGLTIIEKGRGWHSYGEHKAAYEGRSWKQDLAGKVADVIMKSTTREEFIHHMHKYHIDVEFNKGSILFLLSDGKKCGSDKLLTYGDFTKENLEKYIKYNDTLLELGVDDPSIMYEAIGLAARMLNYNDRQQLQNKYINERPFSALEGQALREAIIKLKNSSYNQRNLKQNNEIIEHSNNKAPYLLMTVNELLELALQDKYQQDMLQEYGHGYESENEYGEEQDEWEL